MDIINTLVDVSQLHRLSVNVTIGQLPSIWILPGEGSSCPSSPRTQVQGLPQPPQLC